MKLKEYIKALKKLEKDYGNCECYYSRDDEGNSYDTVKFRPGISYTTSEAANSILGSIDACELNDNKTPEFDTTIVILN